ncbi:hypothetical protein [Amycolatopsis sp. PS_44_ISF1]|uniref:hypothetical protein n=1 Tax=Amycolatopsis sp. PS_44_ISF1 TaxID=2974917 RepID=UPI0028DD723A|nr:hypothetical protein [Amycolatopsis sp. PS_44_ISF1]MDT8915769.1 hypothetical protein [Amycolatopsis sp. PS_44_ISF1]MDT8916287.1 hypothetical protein [Amycolatopsis sp. PS_44_ISF1]MDT8916310.1 hypothetical protein [Amycolatopsis sp. PS_44_ISF1]MDT8916360.1 hypothetical protein [Amycolatopsis sp. PS_44_ISF1]
MASSMTDPTAPVPVAGLLVPAVLVPRIIAAMRGTYPTITADLDDDAAVRAVLKHWVTTTLMTFEAQQVTAPVVDQLAALQEEARVREAEARQKAEAAAGLITDAAPPSADVPAI